VDGIHVWVGARVEQTEVDARMGAPRSRLRRQGQVIGRGTTQLVVRFDGETDSASNTMTNTNESGLTSPTTWSAG
jgi:hypothetical protein